MSKIAIKLVSIDQVIPYENNPRINEETVSSLARSIQKYGFNQPLVVTDKGVIIKGHSRFLAAQKLGLKEVPVIFSDNDRKTNDADRVLDNKIHDLSTWDSDSLEVEMRDVESSIFEILGKEHEKGYSSFSPNEVTDAQVEKAREAIFDHTEKDFITIVCSCGEEMMLNRVSVAGLE